MPADALRLTPPPTGSTATDRREAAPLHRLTYRSNEVPALLGVSRSTWANYVARGLCPPSIPSPTGHTTLYRAESLIDWLKRSEAVGRLLTKADYLADVRQCGQNESSFDPENGTGGRR